MASAAACDLSLNGLSCEHSEADLQPCQPQQFTESRLVFLEGGSLSMLVNRIVRRYSRLCNPPSVLVPQISWNRAGQLAGCFAVLAAPGGEVDDMSQGV